MCVLVKCVISIIIYMGLWDSFLSKLLLFSRVYEAEPEASYFTYERRIEPMFL